MLEPPSRADAKNTRWPSAAQTDVRSLGHVCGDPRVLTPVEIVDPDVLIDRVPQRRNDPTPIGRNVGMGDVSRRAKFDNPLAVAVPVERAELAPSDRLVGQRAVLRP